MRNPPISKSKPKAVRSKSTPRRKKLTQPKNRRWSKVEEGTPIRVHPVTDKTGRSDRHSSDGVRSSPPSQRTPMTQVGRESSGEEREVIIGLDFGTACTKVMIGDDALGEVYAVPFGELAHQGHPYLIATRVYADPDGHLSLTDGQIEISDLKLKLLAGDDQRVLTTSETGTDASALDISAGYLGLVIRQVLHWFLVARAQAYRKTNLIWQVNIGVPSRSYDNESQLDTFRVLAMAAWQTALQEGPIALDFVQGAVTNGRQLMRDYKNNVDIEVDGRSLHPEDVEAVPEVIAEVLAYARSDLRREGTHLLVDVGASTLDVATFVLHTKDSEDRFELLTTEVEKLGAFVLHRQRVADVAKYAEATLNRIAAEVDGISPLPNRDGYLPVDHDQLSEIDQNFGIKCSRLISKVVHVTKTQRNPLAYVWDEDGNLPVFVCGGGRDIPIYVDAVKSAAMTAAPRTNPDLLSLPRPDNLRAEDLSPDEYNRLAVAYGLSTRRDRIGQVGSPAAIEDIRRDVREKVDHRDLYT